MSHSATFTWPPTGASTVVVTGSFDSWSGNSHHLSKKDDGWFEGQVDIPYGEKVSYKYVVDGQWMTREDEAKEWDAAGNMNNVYTAPHEPAPTTKEAEAAAPVAAAAVAAPAVVAEETKKEEPEPVAAAPAAVEKTEPETLLASAAPGATADLNAVSTTQGELVAKEKALVGGEDPVHSSNMIHTTTTVAESSTVESTPVAAPAAAPESTIEAVVKKAEDYVLGVPIVAGILGKDKDTSAAATTSTSTPAVNGGDHSGLAEAAQKYGVAAVGALGVAATGALAGVGEAVHAMTGVDIINKDPVSLEEAKAKGIDTAALPETKGEAAPVSATLPPPPAPVAAAPVVPSIPKGDAAPAPAVEAPVVKPAASLNSLPNGEKKAAAVPANGGLAVGVTGEPVPDVFPSNAEKKDKAAEYKTDLPAQHETAPSNHVTVPQPVITTISEPTKDRSQPQVSDIASKPVSSDPAVDPKAAANTAAAQVTNGNGPEPSRSYIKKDAAPVASIPLSQTQVPTTGKDAIPPSTPTKAAAPVTPASTAPSTPLKTHAKEVSSSDDKMRKRKSSFFAKVKNAFHKDK